jgi:hypothetical protein
MIYLVTEYASGGEIFGKFYFQQHGHSTFKLSESEARKPH